MSSAEERNIHNQAMLQIGTDIKRKIAERLGEWVTVNIGISTNRFLAKYAAGFDKPDGMTLIDHTNLRSKYQNMNLVDLPGINTRFRARLRAAGIYTPLDFLGADMQILKKQVFKSINGYHWYMRLRGYEADAVEFSQKSIGHQHALSDKTKDLDKLERLLVKLCEKTGRRLRKGNYYATGIHLHLGFVREQSVDSPPIGFENMHQLSSWHHGEKVHYRLYSTLDIYEAAKKILKTAEIPRNVSIMSVHVFGLHPWNPEQLNIFDIDTIQEDVRLDRTHYSSISANKRVSDAVDNINNRYGEFVITPAMMLDMQGTILDRIAFGQVRDL
jgi:DNA polymerase-4